MYFRLIQTTRRKNVEDVFNQPLQTPIAIEKCTTSGGRTKEANERSFVFVHQHGGDDVTSKPPKGHLGNTIILFVCRPNVCISIAFVFSRDHCKFQEKLETMLMKNLGGRTKSIMVFSEVAYNHIISCIKIKIIG